VIALHLHRILCGLDNNNEDNKYISFNMAGRHIHELQGHFYLGLSGQPVVPKGFRDN